MPPPLPPSVEPRRVLPPETAELLRDGIAIIEAERDSMVSSFQVRRRGPDIGKVVDLAAKRDIDRMNRWLKAAQAALG